MSSAADESGDLWMVPFADLMSTMVILFMAMYGYAVAKQMKEKEQEKPAVRTEAEIARTEEEKRLAALREKESEAAAALEEELKKRLPPDAFALTLTAERVRLTLASPVLFDSGSDALKPTLAPFLDRLQETLRALPNEVVVEGHTDAVPVRSGPFRSNRELSAARAFRVVERLSRGLDPARFHALGYGEHRPVDTNATREGRARNRRIEISLLRGGSGER